ncbi:transposase [candidate division KSB1 bacterium]|nr:transposase [candidate division KSB1 bacterium]
MNDNSSQFRTKEKLKRYDIPGHAHELTFSCYHRFHYLNDPNCCALFIDELSQAREHFLFRLWAYVLMPNHVHLFIYPTRAGALDTIKKTVWHVASARA